MEETRKERFKRLATTRTSAVLDKLRLLGNLSNRANYDYSEEDVKKIFSAVDFQFRDVKTRFIFKKKKEFSL